MFNPGARVTSAGQYITLFTSYSRGQHEDIQEFTQPRTLLVGYEINERNFKHIGVKGYCANMRFKCLGMHRK